MTRQPTPKQPTPHPSGASAPKIPSDLIPRHVAIVMDGNGRWAKERDLPRTAGHEEAHRPWRHRAAMPWRRRC